MLVDTHAHIHQKDYRLDPKTVLANAKAAGVELILCVGTDADDSELAINLAAKHASCMATVGLHPHDAKLGAKAYAKLKKLAKKPQVVAVGECGLDYFYEHSPKSAQVEALHEQIQLGLEQGLPFIFHVRDAFEDFFSIIDQYQNIRGVVHSFSSTQQQLAQILKRGLYVGLNGIMTFTKDQQQLEAAKAVPTDKLLLETDSPFLTPTPYRGTVNQPANVVVVAEFLANLRDETFEELAEATTTNAHNLFGI